MLKGVVLNGVVLASIAIRILGKFGHIMLRLLGLRLQLGVFLGKLGARVSYQIITTEVEIGINHCRLQIKTTKSCALEANFTVRYNRGSNIANRATATLIPIQVIN